MDHFTLRHHQDRKARPMNVIVFASRKGGTGKSTLAAHLASYCTRASRSCLLIDADPQGSLTLWHRMRNSEDLALDSGLRNLGETLERARRDGVEWVLIDTPPLVSDQVSEAIMAATLVVIPTRPAIFDLNAVGETITVSRLANKPFAVVLNAVPPRRLGTESPMSLFARRTFSALGAPVWSGQITHRNNLAISLNEGGSIDAAGVEQRLAAEEIAGLWSAIERSVEAIHGVYAGVVMHERAAA
jgi:cellulose biosynthesis protein BcsQ